MKILSSRMLLTGLLVLGLSATLLMQPAQSSLMAQQSAPQPSKTFVLPFPGVWSGTYRYVGGNGQVLLYISAAGGLFGSFASDDGLQFAQISGDHRGNAFHIVLTPSPGISDQPGGATPKGVWSKPVGGSQYSTLNHQLSAWRRCMSDQLLLTTPVFQSKPSNSTL